MNTSTARLISNTRLLLFFIFLSTFYNFPLFYLFSYYLSTIISGILWLFSVKKKQPYPAAWQMPWQNMTVFFLLHFKGKTDYPIFSLLRYCSICSMAASSSSPTADTVIFSPAGKPRVIIPMMLFAFTFLFSTST